MKKVLVILGALILVAAIFVWMKVAQVQRRLDALDRRLSNPEVQDAISRAFTGIVHQPEKKEK